MKSPREDEIRIATEAAQWQHALRCGGAEERAQFVDWVRASPRHLQEFLYMEALEAATDGADPERRFDVAKLSAAASANVLALEEPASLARLGTKDNSKGSHVNRWVMSIAASMAIVLLAGILMNYRANTYATAVGEQRSLELADGSVVELNALSRVQVRLSDKAREIELVGGEALFKVSHDPTRPFVVHAGRAEIRALGTQFNVNRRASGTTVSVAEGRVVVGNMPLNAGEGAHVTPDGKAMRKAQEIAEISAWRQRRLVFRDDTLEDIAGEFNRYNKKPRIVLEGDAIRLKRFGGTFNADDPDSIIQVLAGNPILEIDRRENEIVVRAR